MNSKAIPDFWKFFHKLPKQIQIGVWSPSVRKVALRNLLSINHSLNHTNLTYSRLHDSFERLNMIVVNFEICDFFLTFVSVKITWSERPLKALSATFRTDGLQTPFDSRNPFLNGFSRNIHPMLSFENTFILTCSKFRFVSWPHQDFGINAQRFPIV